MKSSVSPFYKFKLTFVGILLIGLCWLLPTQMHAQSGSLSSGVYGAPSSYATPAVAIVRVEAKLALIKSQFEPLTQGSQAFKELSVKYQFYTIIYDQLKAGKTTKESLEAGLKFFSADASADLSKPQKEALKQEAYTLLKP